MSQFAAIIAAGGRGVRVATDTPKQFLSLSGVPILALAIEAFEASPRVGAILVVIPEGAEREYERAMRGRRPRKVLAPVPGGSTRQRSVTNGLLALPREWGWVLVHDAARPFVGTDLIEAVCEAAIRTGAAAPAIPCADTLKEADPAGRVLRTLPRDRVFCAQTPQGFRRDLLEEAGRRAAAEGFEGTDEAVLVERMGAPVSLVPGQEDNRKITTPEDLRFAEHFLRTHPRSH